MSNFNASLPLDRTQAADMANAIRYSAPVNQASATTAAKVASDSTSVKSTSTFSSTVALLKDKVRSKKTGDNTANANDKKQAKEQAQIMRSQVNMIG